MDPSSNSLPCRVSPLDDDEDGGVVVLLVSEIMLVAVLGLCEMEAEAESGEDADVSGSISGAIRVPSGAIPQAVIIWDQ